MNFIANIGLKVKQHKALQYIILLLVVMLGYYPLTFSVYGIGHDFLNCWTPWRYFISSSIENGYFPWWNPYQQMGYPIHADLQGPLWYPENLMAAFLGIQSIGYLLKIHVLHVWLGAIAMLELAKFFKASVSAAVLVAIMYAFSGFYMGHSMHQFAIYSASWIPFLLLFWLKLLETGKVKYVIYGAFVMLLNLTGGNHTFSIISFYLFAILWVVYLKNHFYDKTKRKLLIRNTALYVGCCLFIGSLVFTIYYQVSPYVERIGGLVYKDASIYPFTLTSTLSFINPTSIINTRAIFETDPTMGNAYFTIFGIALLIASLFREKTWIEKVFFVFIAFCLLLSFGDDTPIYKWAFNAIPFIDKFRFPSYFTYFVILLSLPIVARSLSDFKLQMAKHLKWIFSGIALLFLVQIIYGTLHYEDVKTFLALETSDLFSYARNTNFATNLLFFGILGLIITLCYLFFLKKTWLKYIILVELFIFTPFLMYYTTLAEYNPTEIQANIDQHAQPFNQLNLDPINQHGRDLDKVPGLWATVNVYLKNIDPGGFNSFQFSTLQHFEREYPNYLKELYKNPLFYASNQLIKQSDLSQKMMYDSSHTVIDDDNYQSLKNQLSTGPIFTDLYVSEINAERIIVDVATTKTAVLNLLQNYYTGWKVKVNDKSSELLKTNGVFMGVVIPEGKHRVEFYYENTVIVFAASISYGTWIILLILIIVIQLKERRKRTTISLE